MALVSSPQESHNESNEFDLDNVPFKDRLEVTSESALCLDTKFADELIHVDREQVELEQDLHISGNILFIGDTHLCHEFNEKEFDELLDTIERWVNEGRQIDRVVFYGDLVHKFDQRFTKLIPRGEGSFRTNEEPYSEVVKRFNKAKEKLVRLRDILEPGTQIDYIFGNHEFELCDQHKQFYSLLKDTLAALDINILTEDFKELVQIDDNIKASHYPIIKWDKTISKRLFGMDSEAHFFSDVTEFPFYVKDKYKGLIAPEDKVVGAHYHVPWVCKNDDKKSFIFAPSIITNFVDGIPCYREGFMVINPSGSNKVHMVNTSGKAMSFEKV